MVIRALVLMSLLRTPQRRTRSRSSRYSHLNFYGLTVLPQGAAGAEDADSRTGVGQRQAQQPDEQAGIVGPHPAIARRSPIRLNHLTRLELCHPKYLTEMGHSLPLHDGRYHFFELNYFSMEMSSIDKAKSFFSLRFSSSRTFNCRASDTSRPQYIDLHLKKNEILIPCLRHRSPVFAPASCSRRMPMIYSSLNGDCLFVRLHQGDSLYSKLDENQGVMSLLIQVK